MTTALTTQPTTLQAAYGAFSPAVLVEQIQLIQQAMSEAMIEADCVIFGITFRPVAGFTGYRVGTDGSVWSCRGRNGFTTWHPLKPGTHPKGHRFVNLHGNGKQHCAKVHHLVLNAFVGPCPAGFVARHFPDRNPSNNSLENLQWGTHSENGNDRLAHGTDFRGEKGPSAKLTQEDVRYIRAVYVPGNRTFGQGALARRFGVDQSTISRIISGENWIQEGDNNE